MFGAPGRPTRKAADDLAGRVQKDAKKGAVGGEGDAVPAGGKDKDEDAVMAGRERVQELQLMEALATLTLQLDEERAVQSRAQNIALEGPSENDFLKVMDWAIEQRDQSGVGARKAAKGMGEAYLGNPFSKRPVALFSGVLFRELAESAPAAAKSLLDQFAVVGKQASVQAPEFRASRCSKIECTKSDDGPQDCDVTMSQWRFAIPSCSDVESFFLQAREAQLFRGVGIELDFDRGPRSKAAKNVANIAFGSDSAKGTGKGKG
ncbi:unnamed protein product, partial [Prorocentrum cordatum]